MISLATRFFRILLAAACLLGLTDSVLAQGDIKNGQYLAKAGGCAGCHTDSNPGSAPYAGGRALDTPFGTFFGPNLTPHNESGLGKWAAADFARAIRKGERPDGTHYYPAFPYPSFTAMTDSDIRDLWAFMRSLPAVDRPNQQHKLKFPFGWRYLVTFWKWLFFTPQTFVADPKLPAIANRGAYLVGVLGHCGECHTPRNFLGGTKKSRLLAGAKMPEGRTANLTPDGLKKWTEQDLVKFFKDGVTPAGDVTADTMGEVVMNTTSQLKPEDVAAVIAYLRSIPALASEK